MPVSKAPHGLPSKMSLNSSITSQGAVKYNAQRDVGEHSRRKKQKRDHGQPAYNDTGDDNDLSIMPRDLCLRNRVKTRYKRMYTDTDVNVFSSANRMSLGTVQLPSDPSADEYEEARIAMRQNYDFGGIAVTRSNCDASSAAGGDKEMVVLFGGTYTIRNTGLKPIYSGNYVMWDLPSLNPALRRTWKSDQVPHTKLVFETVPYNANTKYLIGGNSQVTRERVRREAATLGATPSGDENAFATALQKFDAVFSDARRRVIGRALSNAEPGKEFDIVLGRYMA